MKALIPKDWSHSTVGDACSIRNDLRLPISREERSGMSGNFPYYGPTGVLDRIDGYRLDGTYALIGEDGDHFLDVEKKTQTILVSGKFNVNNHAHVIETTAQCSAEWFYNYFRHRSLKPYLTRQGAGRYKLNKAALQSIPIVLPSLNEQEAINRLFREWSKAVEIAEKQIGAKEKRHAALVQFLITSVTARRHWGTVEFGNVVAERNEKTEQHDQYPVLTSSRRGLFLQSEYFSKQVTSEDNTGYKVMRCGDFTFRSMSDDGRFVFNRLTHYDAGVISPAYGVFRATDCSPAFLTHFMNSSYFANVLNRESQGGTRKALRFSAIASTEIDFPSRQQQENIARILDSSRNEIDVEKERLTQLQLQIRGLMQKLLTGQWRVKVPEAEAA